MTGGYLTLFLAMAVTTMAGGVLLAGVWAPGAALAVGGIVGGCAYITVVLRWAEVIRQ